MSEDDLKSYIQAYYQLYDSKIKTISQNMNRKQVHRINLDETDVLKEMREFIIDFKTN